MSNALHETVQPERYSLDLPVFWSFKLYPVSQPNFQAKSLSCQEITGLGHMSMRSDSTGLSRDSLFSDIGLTQEAKPSQFEESLPNEEKIPWQRDLLETYLHNQLKLAPVMPLIALLLSLAA